MRFTVLAVALFLAGCASSPEEASAGEGATPAGPVSLQLQCIGHGGAIPALEAAGSERCWHHIGHNTYYVGAAYRLWAINGSAFAVEGSLAGLAEDERAVIIDASLDGREWEDVATVPYRVEEEDRNSVPINVTVDGLPFRFVRFSVPPSPNDGLAGYLDGSAAELVVTPLPAEPLPPKTSGDCADGDLLEAFFDEHPCWFGGYDESDDVTGSGEPDLAHVSPPIVYTFDYGRSYYDSPSFLHTYFIVGSEAGTMEGTLTSKFWRTSQVPACAARADRPVGPTSILFLVQTSPDGRIWADAARVYHPTGDGVPFTAGVPAGTQFIRFQTGQGFGSEEGACYHSQAFLVDSRFAITTAA